MAAFVLLVLVAMAATHPAAALYCLCDFGANSTVLQNNIVFACGNGADCSAIAPNGACYYPNTLADHCNYAWNSYFHNSQMPGSCSPNRTVMLTLSPPSGNAPGCVYQPTGASVLGDVTEVYDKFDRAATGATLPSIGLICVLVVWFFFLM